MRTRFRFASIPSSTIPLTSGIEEALIPAAFSYNLLYHNRRFTCKPPFFSRTILRNPFALVEQVGLPIILSGCDQTGPEPLLLHILHPRWPVMFRFWRQGGANGKSPLVE